MPPFALSAVVRKAWELGRNRLDSPPDRPAMVTPGARYAPRGGDGVLVLQNGPNPSTDYYLRPRLEGLGVPVVFADLQDPPRRCRLMASSTSLTVIFCRYASGPWLDALEAAGGRLARVAYFMDDDVPAMIAAPDLPLGYRRRLARGFGAHVRRLSGLASEVWVSSDVLAQRYADSRPQVLTPLPDEDPPEPSAAPSSRVVYHSTGVHGPERQFVVEVARRLAAAGSPAAFEITGDAAVRRACVGLANVAVVPQTSWPAFQQRQRGASAAIALAPLHASPINEARAPPASMRTVRPIAASFGLIRTACCCRWTSTPGPGRSPTCWRNPSAASPWPRRPARA